MAPKKDHKNMKVKLAKKVKLQDQHGLLMKMGIEYKVPKNQFWLKRLKDGDVIELGSKSAKVSDNKPKNKSGGK